MHHIGDT